MKKISLFKNFTKEISSKTLSEVVEEIRGDRYRESVLKIRERVKSGDEETVSRLKKGMVAFTVSGLFEGGRKMSFLKTYNPFVILDIDKLDLEMLPDLTLKAKAIPFTKVLFVSPSGRGLKIVVEVNTDREKHGVAYRQVMNFYKENLKVEIDQSGKDITRLCFMSHDPEAYYNEGSAVFNILNQNNYPAADAIQNDNQGMDQIPGRAPDLSIEEANLSGNYQDAFGVCVMQTNAKLEFKKGNRNNYIYQLGVNCIHAGIPLEVAVNESKKVFDLNKTEIERTIKSAYTWKPAPPPDSSIKDTVEITREIQDELPPGIPPEIYNKLPPLLSRGCEVLIDRISRDVFLSGALGVLSGCLPGVKGKYDRKFYSSHLFVFVIAAAGSGKGVLSFAEDLARPYDDELIESSKKELKEYKKAMIVFNRDIAMFKKGKLEEPPTEPDKPANKCLLIPANTSAAKFIDHLNKNEGTGILFESEADSLGNSLKQEWGGYSDLMRKGFQHETISYSRKSNEETTIVKRPKLSIVISGTPSQVTALIPTSENGLFSRFMFYAFEADPEWRDVSPNEEEEEEEDIEMVYEELSKEVIEMIRFYQKNPVVFKLQRSQWNILNGYFSIKSKKMLRDFGHKAIGIVRRMGLICFRIAMVLTAIRKFEERHPGEVMICEDDDFESAMSLTKMYFEHGFFIYDRLPTSTNNKLKMKNENKQLFYDNLPNRFQRKEAIVIARKIPVPKRSADRYLEKLLKANFLGKLPNGIYYKK